MRVLRLLNILSLDVAVGAIACTLAIARLLGVKLSVVTLLVLALTVWLIYTLDHLWDAATMHKPRTHRHAFHKKYRVSLILTCIGVLLVNGVLTFYLPVPTVRVGVFLISLVACYLLVMHLIRVKVGYHKEVTIAVLYSAGVALPAVSLYEGVAKVELILMFFQFIIVAFVNLIIFSIYDSRIDAIHKMPSIVHRMGVVGALNVVYTSIGIFTTLGLGLIIWQPELVAVQCLLFMMLLILLGLLKLRRHFKNEVVYRALGDGVFFMPLVYLLF